MQSARMILVLLIFLVAAEPASRPGADPSTAAIAKAIEVCAREFDAYLRDQSATIRTESDYFKQNPSPDVKLEAVLRVLERPMDVDPRLQAYVKWQLLSAVPDKFDAALLSRAGQVYLRAPAPQQRPGTAVAEQQAMMTELQANRNKLDELNEKHKKRVADFLAAQEPILKYRTALFAHLPVSGEAIAAGFEDVATRAAAGAEFDKFLDTLLGSARNWVLDGKASPKQIAALTQLVERVKNTKAPSYYDQAAINSKGAPYWKTRTAPNPDKGEKLTKFLQFVKNSN
jgi:hypothetical protein